MSEANGERRDGLRADITALRGELRIHVEDEANVLLVLKDAMRELGSSEQIRERRVFLEMLLKREESRAKLTRAIIEKSLLGAVWAVAVFFLIASWNEIVGLINHARGRS